MVNYPTMNNDLVRIDYKGTRKFINAGFWIMHVKNGQKLVVKDTDKFLIKAGFVTAADAIAALPDIKKSREMVFAENHTFCIVDSKTLKVVTKLS